MIAREMRGNYFIGNYIEECKRETGHLPSDDEIRDEVILRLSDGLYEEWMKTAINFKAVDPEMLVWAENSMLQIKRVLGRRENVPIITVV